VEEREMFRDTAASGTTGLHAVALSDNARVRPYVLAMLVAGCIVLAMSVSELWVVPPPAQWWVLVILTLISGSAVLKIPAVPVNFSISDVFTLTSAVVFGPAAGTALVAIDSLVLSGCLIRTGLSLERILFNATAPPVAMWVSAVTFFHASGLHPLREQPLGIEVVGPWLLAFAAMYFVLNTFSIAVAVALHERANVLRIWQTHFKNLWFAFIGGGLGAAIVVFALQHGTYGMVILSLPILLAVILHFAYRNATGRVADRLQHLEQVNRMHLSTIEALAHAVNAKDGVTHDHIRRVQTRAIELATRLGVDSELQLKAIEAAALLHDVGKLAIPEHILNKPGSLTPAEFERMKSHARIGAEILSEVDFPYPVVPIVRHHHENWDGTGYPDGLKGDDIPIGARILAVVDCFDALTSDRPYRRALSVRETFKIIDSRRGTIYDPAIVDTFHEMCASSMVDEEPVAPDAHTVAEAATSSVSTESCALEPCDEARLALELGASLSHGLGGRCAWAALTDGLCGLPDVDTVVLFVVDEAKELLTPRYVSGRHTTQFERLAISVGERMSGWVAAVGQPMVNADAALDLFDVDAVPLRTALAIPCQGPDDSRAVMALYSSRTEAFTPTHQRVVLAGIAFLARLGAETRAAADVISIDARRRTVSSGRRSAARG